ncbi:MAG: hypothetical protein NTU41_03670, partial [Chloroflexi bacterium]|nr:hypothetical protein [Chloroflexota bacterium]
ILFASFLFGAIGGVFDALSALSDACGKKEFDLGYWVWHVTSPFLGAILGMVVFGTILSGILATTGSGIAGLVNQTNITQGTSTPAQGTVTAALVLVVAFIAGFKQTTVRSFGWPKPYSVGAMKANHSPERSHVQAFGRRTPTND